MIPRRCYFSDKEFGVALFFLITLGLLYSCLRGFAANRSNALQRGSGAIATRQRMTNIQRLLANDPKFDEMAFCKRVGTAFFKIQEAWCAQDLKDVQLFISDGMAEQYSLQFAEQRDEHYREQLDAIGIEDLQIIDVYSTGIFDEISVRIGSHATRSRRSLSDGRAIDGSISDAAAVEIWSFLRTRGAVTDASKPGLIEGHCPNCGQAVMMNQTAHCSRCQSLLRSGQFDWVLCEVTQFSQWERSLDDPVPGLEQLLQKDAGFSRQALEDRAAVIFWRRVRADRMGKFDPLRKVASDSFCDHYALSVKTPREYAGQCALGGVQMVSFIPASEAEPLDRIVVKIRWSGKLMTVGADGRRIPGGDLFQTNAMVLGRRAGAQTDVSRSVASTHCPHCGAPESQSGAIACPACGAVQSGDLDNWMLLEWHNFADPMTRALLNPLQTPEAAPTHADGLLAWAVKMAAADGWVDPRERALLDRFAEHDGCGAAGLDRMIGAALNGKLVCPEPSNAAEARDWIGAIIRIAASDGKIDRKEMALLKWLGEKAKLSEDEVERLVEREQSQRSTAARER